jgi:DNA-binding GntR family transcriptional regulator
MSDHPIVRQDSSQVHAVALHVASVLREKIVKAQLMPSDRIVERQLSQELGVSRTPVREALKLLEADGLVQILRNRGAQVTGLTADQALLLFEVIAALEGAAARRLAGALTPQVLDRLEDLHAQILFHYKRSQIDPYFEANSAAHDLIVESCGNPVLMDHHRRNMLMARRGRYMAIMSPERWAQSINEHETLMAAFRSGDANAAAAVWTTHLNHTGASLAEVIRGHTIG